MQKNTVLWLQNLRGTVCLLAELSVRHKGLLPYHERCFPLSMWLDSLSETIPPGPWKEMEEIGKRAFFNDTEYLTLGHLFTDRVVLYLEYLSASRDTLVHGDQIEPLLAMLRTAGPAMPERMGEPSFQRKD